MAGLEVEYTTLEEVVKIHATLHCSFDTGLTRPIQFRKQQLSQLSYLVHDNVEKFEAALVQDLGRPVLESHIAEISACINPVVEAYNKVDKWAKTERAPFSLNFGILGPKVRKEPKGVVLIISPFNYPASLCIGPLAAAIAAGNAAVIKPSESTPAVSKLLADLFPKYMDTSVYRVVNGSIPDTTKLLELRWNHIHYTGNARVARIVAAAAAKYLTPVTLELGGKSPVFVDPKCDLNLAARRIAWGKFMNSGQTCTAPDYILIPHEAQDMFVAAFTEEYNKFYPEGPQKSKSFARMVSEVHFERLKSLLEKTKGIVVLGGDTAPDQKYIAPTLVKDVTPDDPLMDEEIFGPILPIIPLKDWDEAIAVVNSRANPLALYLFSNSSELKTKVFDRTSSGAAICNDVALHPAISDLPFGGVGESGYGYQGGKYGFDTFTHFRATLDSPKLYDIVMGNRYPPYTDRKLSIFKKLLYPTLPPRVGQSRWRIWRWISAIFGK